MKFKQNDQSDVLDVHVYTWITVLFEQFIIAFQLYAIYNNGVDPTSYFILDMSKMFT